MNPGIYYFYEYENKQRRRNVGFLKISRHYHSCILQIHIRGIPAGNGASLELFAFCAGKGKVSGAQIATLTCFRRSVSARLPVSVLFRQPVHYAQSSFPSLLRVAVPAAGGI